MKYHCHHNTTLPSTSQPTARACSSQSCRWFCGVPLSALSQKLLLPWPAFREAQKKGLLQLQQNGCHRSQHFISSKEHTCCGLLIFSLNVLFLMLTPNHFHGSEWSFSVFVLSTSKKQAVALPCCGVVNAVVCLSVRMLLCFAPHSEAQRLPRRWRRENSSI